jgi:4-amino-4-deoxy-L-arabinose transferase-like glycosyltransferase
MLVGAGLAITVATQAMLSTLATSGVGAATANASTGVVVASILASVATALLLELDGVVSGLLSLVWLGRRRWRISSAQLLALRAQVIGLVRARLSALVGRRFTWNNWLCLIGGAFALVLSVGADVGAREYDSRPLAQWLWIASVVLLFLAASLRRAKPSVDEGLWCLTSEDDAPGGEQTASTWMAGLWRRCGDLLLLVVLVLGALLLRLPNLTSLPYVVHGDEASNGEQALLWLNGDVPSLLSVGWYGLSMAGYGLPALVMRFAGADLYGLRLSSVLIGVLSIVLLYALAREVAGRRVAFVAAGLMAVANSHIQWSRMGIHYIHAPAVILFTLWMLVRALRRNSATAAIAAGVGLSLALQVYFSARIVFALIPLFLLGLLALNRRALKGRVGVLGWLALGAFVACGPLVAYVLTDTSALVGRAQAVLILNGTTYMQGHLHDLFGTDDFGTIFKWQLAAVPLLLSGLADQSEQYGPHYAMEDPLVAGLMLVGFWLAVLSPRRPLHLLLALWVLGTVILGGVLTIDMPWWPRLLAMLPALCLLAALASERVLRLLESVLTVGVAWLADLGRHILRWRLTIVQVLVTTQIVALIATANVLKYSLDESVQNYFVAYPAQVNNDSYRTRYTDLSYLAAQLPSGTHVVLFAGGDMLWDYATIRFLAPDVQGKVVRDATELGDALAARTGPVVVIIPVDMNADFQKALNASGLLPSGFYQPHYNAFGHTTLYTYSVGGP